MLQTMNVKQKLIEFFKNRQTIGFLISIVVMAIIALAFFFSDNFDGNSLRQHDMQQGFANGQEIADYRAATGEDSRWTNSLFSGMPTFQISPSYPSDNLFRWITSVYGLGLPSPSNLLFMMMLGFMILMMSLKVRWEYSLIGAVAWAFSTYFIIIIGAGHIWKFVTLSYIPPTIAGVILAYRGRYLAGGALAALFMMMQLMSNHVQMSYYFGLVVVILALSYLVQAIREGKLKRWLAATAVIFAAFVMGASANLPNMYHTARYAKETQRATSEIAADTGEGESGVEAAKMKAATAYSYGKAETMTLLIPNAKGGSTIKIVNGNPANLLSLAELDQESDVPLQLLRQLPQYFGEPEATNGPVYVGAIIFALFILGCIVVKGPLKWGLVAATVLSILLAWGGNFPSLTEFFVNYVPLYGNFRAPESMLVVAEFAMPLLGVIGLYKVLSSAENLAKYKLAILYSFGIVAFVTLLYALFPSITGLEDEMSRQVGDYYPEYHKGVLKLRASMVSADAWRSFIYVALGGCFLWLAVQRTLKPIWSAAAVGVLILFDLYSVDKRYVSSESFTDMPLANEQLVQPSAIDRQILALGDTTNYRVMDFSRFGSAVPSAFHKMIGGYHSAKLGRYNDLIQTGLIFDPYVYGMLNAKYEVTQEGELRQNPYALGNAWFVGDIQYVDKPIEELSALQVIDPARQAVADKRFSPLLGQAVEPADGDYIRETSYAPNRLTYQSRSASENVAVFSEVFFPWGWEATIDGNPVEIGRVNYVLRALRVPAGTHEIVMTFNPSSVRQTQAVATCSVIVIYLAVIAAIVCPFVCRKKKDETDETKPSNLG